ncbi:modifier of mdg4-like isoform X3 [Anopheles cruzii]|uniref:modifier of mdg4-like isoform X3 n=1 Tax=Anopheles cruzii TaxID=68878 RepID=UPI0022EC83E0|nr:modifier of mdg4-like isoform X3 [Anopheles cruzii]
MADDEQFSLCWNNFNTNLSAGFHESLVQGDLVDVTLAAEGQLVKAHRLILSVCSPYFRKMFTQMPVNQHAFIFLKDVSHSALKDLIQFMYCGEVNVKQDALPAFISTAEALQIKGLTETGDSAPPPQPSPAKENIPTTPAPVSISTNTGSARGKVQRSRVQSYKLESEESGDDKIVQIQSSTSHHSATASQQAQQIQQVHVATGQKRILGQRILAPSMTNKRAKLSVSGNDILDPSEATTQIQAVQIVKQLPSQTTEPEYVEMALEPISTKAEPDYSEEHTEIETVEAETEQDQSLAEHDQSADQEQEQGDDEGTYVEDEAYGDMAKYEESYFTEGEEGKAGVSGFAEPYTSDGTGNEQAAQAGKSASHRSILIHKTPKTKRDPDEEDKNSEDSHNLNPATEKAIVEKKPTPRKGGPTVNGFVFPLQEKIEVERLERMINADKNIRHQYISYLARCKPNAMKIQQFLSSIFSDDALNEYNFHGSNSSGKCKIPMKTYSVFYDCFLEAFNGVGLDERALQAELTAAIKHSRNRTRQRCFRARKHREKQYISVKLE